MSPQTRFSCPPCSVLLKEAGQQPTKRLTYCALNAPSIKLQCFSEIPVPSPNLPVRSPSSIYEIKNSHSPVLLLETIHKNTDDNKNLRTSLIAVHKSGEVRAFAEDLSEELWHTEALLIPPEKQVSAVVEFAAVVSGNQACKALLKGREDVLAALGAGTASTSGGLNADDFLIMITRSSKSRRKTENFDFRLFSISASSSLLRSGHTGVRGKPLQELLSIKIPVTPQDCSEKYSYSFSAAIGVLYQHSRSSVTAYDLTGSVLRLKHVVQLPQDKICCIVPISHSKIAVTTPSSINVINLRYQSNVTSQSLALHGLSTDHNGELQTSEANSTHGTSLLSYFAPLNKIIAIQGRSLIAFDTSFSSLGGSTRKRTRDDDLTFSLDCGIRKSNETTASGCRKKRSRTKSSIGITQHQANDRWEEQKSVLDLRAIEGNTNDFENIMCDELGLNLIDQGQEFCLSDSINKVGIYSGKKTLSSLDERKIRYLLTRFFTTDDVKPSTNGERRRTGLKIQFFPEGLFRWLLNEGHLSVQAVEASLKDTGFFPPNTTVEETAIVQALAKWDPSLNLIGSMLSSSIEMSAQSVTHTLRISLNTIQSLEKLETTKLLTNGESRHGSEPADDIRPINEDHQHVSRSLNAKASDIVRTVMQAAMQRLQHHPDSDIITALRAELTQSELVKLMEELRIGLAQSGCLSRYMENEMAEDSCPRDDQICINAKLLNCTIDSLGIRWWIMGQFTADDITETADIVGYMQAEISAALEGIEEAAYLQGLLKELLQYNGTTQTRIKRPNAAIVNRPPTETNSMSSTKERQQNHLPLGMKAPLQISVDKIGAGGELQKRSKRDIGRLLSQQVPKYSFEQIIL